jgi:hypothetical protein
MLETLIIMSIDFLPRTSSRASPHFFMDLTIAHMVFIHERMAMCLDALVLAHVLIMVIVPRVGTVFLLQGVTLTLSRGTWMVHVFPVVVHVPLAQMLRCKRL